MSRKWRAASRRVLFLLFPAENVKNQTKFFFQFDLPLFAQGTGRDDQDTASVVPHDEFVDKKTGHNGLSRSGIIGQNKPQRLTGRRVFING